jgi:hypothetical protein
MITPELIDIVEKHADRFERIGLWKADCDKIADETGERPYYRVAYRFIGIDFYDKITSKMIKTFTRTEFKKTAKWRNFTDEELKVSAKQFDYRVDWKSGDYWKWIAAINRGPDRSFYEECCAHMEAKANVYLNGRSVYVFEFTDHYANVGESFDPVGRKDGRHGHLVQGKVCDHIKVCPTYEWKVLQSGIMDGNKASQAEKDWDAVYRNSGWTMLNSKRALGSLGGRKGANPRVYPLAGLVDEEKIASVIGFKTRTKWMKGKPDYYWEAKRRDKKNHGFYEQVVASLPKRAPKDFIAPISEETRAKMSASGTRRTSNPVWKAQHSAKLTGRPHEVSPETRLKISASNKGKPKSEAHKQAMRDAKRLRRESGVFPLRIAKNTMNLRPVTVA